MAYGQTSSGKTYTMGTGAPSSEDRGSVSEGIIPRAMGQLFWGAKRPPPVYPGYKMPPLKTTFRVSFVEIYNEDLIDLLVKGDFRPPVTIREDSKGHIFWTGVQEIVVTSVEEVIHLLWFGSQNRQTHSTEMNEKSSRSHAIFSITLRQEKFVPTHPPPPQSHSSPPSPAVSTEPQDSLAFRRAHSKSPSSGNVSLLNGNTAANGPTASFAPGFATGRPGTPTASTRPGTPTTSAGATPSSIPAPFTSGIVAPGSKLKRQSTMMDSIHPPPSPSSSTAAAQAIAAAASDDPEPEGEWVTLNSKFHFVDLAGSERLKRTSAIGDRAKEGISINAGLHALGNVISALGDPSKRASHVPYRDSKLTRLLQDSLGGNALALMIACVSPSELNLGETLNTLKYANRARNIKNSSSLNQEINMDNPEYLRSVIQKLKQEIKMLKEAGATRAGTSVGDEAKGMHSNRHSITSTSTIAHGSGGAEDSMSEDRALSPSPSRRLSHYQSRESISTDISHGCLDSVQEEDDRCSDISSSARTAIADSTPTPTPITNASTSNADAPDTAAAASTRSTIPPFMIPPSLDSKSFQEFVEPVIEEYEKVITGLESHLAATQAALNHSAVILEEQQGHIGAIQDENRELLQRQQEQCKSSNGDISHQQQQLQFQQQQQQQQQLQQELEQALQRIQEQLREAESRRTESEQYIQDLEQKLAQEKATAQEQIQRIQMEKEQAARSQTSSPVQPQPDLAAATAAVLAKELELRELSEKVQKLEEQYRLHQEQTEAEAEPLREEQAARDTSSRASTPTQVDSDHTKDEWVASEVKREEELLEKLQASTALEIELKSEKARLETLAAEVEAVKTMPHSRIDSGVDGQDHSKDMDDVIQQLNIVSPPSNTDISVQSQQIQELESELSKAKESERILRDETTALIEKLEKFENDQKTSLEMEEMLRLAVADLESRLEGAQEGESKRQEELEQNLARIQELEDRSTKAEQEALQIVEELKTKLVETKASAEEQLADELLELLEKMEEERTKVEALQTQVENHLAELATEKARATELEASRDAIQAQWDVDKERILTLEKEIDEQSLQIKEKAALIATLGEQVSAHEGTLASKEQLQQSLDQQVLEHGKALEAKLELIQELEKKVQSLELSLEESDPTLKDQVIKVQSELTVALEQLAENKTMVQEQERVVQDLSEKISTLESDAIAAKESFSDKDAERLEMIQGLETKVKMAEADRDDMETQLEDAERRHQAVDGEIKVLQSTIAQHLETIDQLETRLSEAHSSSSSRPASISSSSAAIVTPGEDPTPVIQKLEMEKARYRALVRENEKEIARLSKDLETLASEFTDTATMFEDAEEDLKSRITELEAILEEKNLGKPSNTSSTSLATSIASTQSTHNHENAQHASSATVPAATKAQISTLKAERDQALETSEELSQIVAELNEMNHSLQERLLNLEREQESIKLQHVLEGQAQQDEIRTLKDRAERLDRNASPSPMGQHHHRHQEEEERGTNMHERILNHKLSTSSDQFASNRGEDSLATPRQSWSTTASSTLQHQSSTQARGGRHESTLIQQAKHIKLLEERIAELQSSGGSPMSTGEGPSHQIHRMTSSASTASAVGLGIQHKSSDQELTRSLSTSTVNRQSIEKVSPALRALSTLAPSGMAPPTPPPTAPLPALPAGAILPKHTPAHLNGNSGPPLSPRHGAALTLDTSSPGSSPHMKPSRTGSIASRTAATAAAVVAGSHGLRHERDSTSSNISELNHINGHGSSNGCTSPTSSVMSTGAISAATAQALQGVEANELRGVVDTLAHQVQALKVEQTMQLGKIHRLEAALAEAEEKLKSARSDQDTTLAQKEALARELEQVRAELTAAKVKSETDRAGLEGILEREKKERERAVETRAIMEARMEELMGRKSKFACF
ncbi:hypothetical protein BG011_000907 [Mortierella polycephala]|uniref:Kinesin motor domain-containing protein n=1 Tax=Mortierella polycephala TaxID=41804 RepID=A0A9P6U6S1_9FUNG|nr:hypothetical protein BG011_000907 [Mortierella polycephala]